MRMILEHRPAVIALTSAVFAFGCSAKSSSIAPAVHNDAIDTASQTTRAQLRTLSPTLGRPPVFALASNTCSTGVHSHGGGVITHPRIHNLYVQESTGANPDATKLDAYWSQLGNDAQFWFRLSEYGVGQGSVGDSDVFTPGFVAAGKPQQASESDIQDAIDYEIENNRVSYHGDGNDIYVVYLASGHSSQLDKTANPNYAGHHQSYTERIGSIGRPIIYAVIEYSDIDTMTALASHEISEAVTDWDGTGYFSDTASGGTGAEIGDFCQTRPWFFWDGHLAEQVWSELACACIAQQDDAFDANFYVNYYADLKAAFGGDYAAARNHYWITGLPIEGRRGSPAFDVHFYLDQYPDLKNAYGSDYVSAARHWMQQGLPNEARRASIEFDVNQYLAGYADLKAAFGTDYRRALNHWVIQGLPYEGRRASREFDVKFYLTYYSDLAATFGTDYRSALRHWVLQGLPVEGRRGAPEFDVSFYVGHYPDLGNAFGHNYQAAMTHWLLQGLPYEGRRGAREFDVQFYLKRYADLQQAFGNKYQAAFDHWLIQGLTYEGRRGAREFDVQFYLGHYADLKNAFGTNYSAALSHWIYQGLPHEGRTGALEVDVSYYLANYPDLQNAFGNNYLAAIDHWINQGLPVEGRRASLQFDVQYYLNSYSDLKAAFGNNYTLAFDHWVINGIAEGRKGAP